MRELTTHEIERISGGWGPVGGAVGAIGGGATYIGGSIGSGEGSWTGFAAAVVTGAAAGFVAGPAAQFGANAIIAGTAGFYAGFMGGSLHRIGDS